VQQRHLHYTFYTIFNLVQKLTLTKIAQVVIKRSKIKNWELGNLITAKNGVNNKNKLKNAIITIKTTTIITQTEKREKSFRVAAVPLPIDAVQTVDRRKFNVWTCRYRKILLNVCKVLSTARDDHSLQQTIVKTVRLSYA